MSSEERTSAKDYLTDIENSLGWMPQGMVRAGDARECNGLFQDGVLEPLGPEDCQRTHVTLAAA